MQSNDTVSYQVPGTQLTRPTIVHEIDLSSLSSEEIAKLMVEFLANLGDGLIALIDRM